jgi:hypothetical protein
VERHTHTHTHTRICDEGEGHFDSHFSGPGDIRWGREEVATSEELGGVIYIFCIDHYFVYLCCC